MWRIIYETMGKGTWCIVEPAYNNSKERLTEKTKTYILRKMAWKQDSII